MWGKTCSSYTRASKAEQGTCQGKLGRVYGAFLRTFELAYNSQIFGVDIIRNFFSKTFSDLANSCDPVGFLCREESVEES